MDHGQEALGELIVTGGDCAVDFQTTEEALDLIALLVERPVMFDFHPPI